MLEILELDFQKPLPLPPLKRSFITKNEYNTKVKVTDWDRARESEPKDYDAFDPPGGSLLKSSYRFLGNCKDESWESETQHMLEQIKLKGDINLRRVPMLSYGNYAESSIPENEKWKMSPEDCTTDYQSTMHASYKTPVPYVMKPLAFKKAPFLQNRRLVLEAPYTDTNKFFDDCWRERVALAQKYNSFHYKSFNPCTCKYSDGSEIYVKKHKLFDLPFNHVDD